MPDIKYVIGVDGSKAVAGVRATFAQMEAEARRAQNSVFMAPDPSGNMHDLMRNYEAMRDGQEMLRDEADETFRAYQRGSERMQSRDRVLQAEKRTLGDRYRDLNRGAQMFMRTGAAAAAAVAVSFNTAIDAATRFDRRFTALNHSTAALSREWRKLRQDFDAGMAGGVRAVDGAMATGLSWLRTGFNATTSVVGAGIRSVSTWTDPRVAWEQQVAADYAARMDTQAAGGAAVANRLGRIDRLHQAEMARISGDDIKGFELRGRQGLQDQAVAETERLMKGEITDQEYIRIVDTAKAQFEAELSAMKERKSKQDAADFQRALDEDAQAFEHMLMFREEWMQDQAEAAKDAVERSERERRGSLSLYETMRAADIDVGLEESRAREMGLRARGLTEDADRVRLDMAYQTDRRRAQIEYGSLIDRALTDEIPAGERQGFISNAQDLLARVLTSIDAQYKADLAMLGADPLAGMGRGRDAGQGLIVSPGASDVVKGRVFGMPSERQAQRDQLAEAKKSAKLLERIERNTRGRVGTYGP